MQGDKINGKAVASLILACLSIVCCCAWYIGMLLGLVAVVLGILAIRDNKAEKSDMAIAGIVVGGVGFALGAAIAICYLIVFTGINSGMIHAAIQTGITI